MKSDSLVVCSLLMLAILVLASAACAQETAKALRVNGAGMACDQMQLWATAFTADHPEIPVIVTGSSAGKGFEALFNGNADLALASRVIGAAEQKRASEIGLKLDTKLIGYAGLAMVTHQRNPIDELTMDQLRRIFSAEYTSWNQVGGPDEPIRCLTRRIPESGGALFFLETVLHNQPYGKTTVFTESWTAVMKVCSVAKQDLPIGMGPLMLASREPVKVIAVKQDENSPAIKPTERTLRDKSYPIIVPIRLYWNERTSDNRIAKFAAFCASKGLIGDQK